MSCFRFHVSDVKYTYNIGICKPAIDDDAFSEAGVIQMNRITKNNTKYVGNFTSADIVGGSML